MADLEGVLIKLHAYLTANGDLLCCDPVAGLPRPPAVSEDVASVDAAKRVLDAYLDALGTLLRQQLQQRRRDADYCSGVEALSAVLGTLPSAKPAAALGKRVSGSFERSRRSSFIDFEPPKSHRSSVDHPNSQRQSLEGGAGAMRGSFEQRQHGRRSNAGGGAAATLSVSPSPGSANDSLLRAAAGGLRPKANSMDSGATLFPERADSSRALSAVTGGVQSPEAVATRRAARSLDLARGGSERQQSVGSPHDPPRRMPTTVDEGADGDEAAAAAGHGAARTQGLGYATSRLLSVYPAGVMKESALHTSASLCAEANVPEDGTSGWTAKISVGRRPPSAAVAAAAEFRSYFKAQKE